MEIFPSTLIIAKTDTDANTVITNLLGEIAHELTPNNPDIIILNDISGWGIDQVRNIKKFLQQKPFNHDNKAVLIFNAHNLNTEAQNALLKVLEEPGEGNYIFLITNKPKSLLPTISSRCYIINVQKSAVKTQGEIICFKDDIKKNLAQSEELGKNKEDVLPLLQSQLILYQQKLTKNPDPKTAAIIKKIIKAIQMINANVDPKSALDYIFLN